MYKINLNGTQVETESADEVRTLLYGSASSLPEKTIPSTKLVKKVNKKYSGTEKSMVKWLPEEVKYIIDNANSMNTSMFKKSGFLQKRHTPAGIGYMCYRIKGGGKKFTDDIQPIVDEYHKTKGTLGTL